MPLSLLLDGATVVLKIGQKEFTLTAPRSELTLPDSAQPNTRQSARVKFAYHESYENAPEFPTPQELLQGVEQLLGNAVPPSGRLPLEQQWDEFRSQIQRVPVLNQVADTVLTTTIRITDIVLDMTFVKTPAGDAKFDGSFTFGLMFTPATRPRLFNAELIRFGARISVKLAGNANANDLGFNWSPPS